jgi:integrase
MPKRVPPLSAKTLANIRIGKHAIELADGYVPGLRVRVLPSGTRSWSLNIRNNQGVRRRFDLGAGLSLGEARLVLKWLMWTRCRLNEAAGMTWGEIQSDKWTIPALRSKSKRARTIPLTSQALSLLGEREPRDPNALVFPSARGGLLSNWDRVTKALHTASGTAAWHRHDLRRTVATMLGDLGFAPHVISVVLGHAHVAEGATAVYARSRYQREHQEALQTLAAEFERIVTDEGKVLLLSAAS